MKLFKNRKFLLMMMAVLSLALFAGCSTDAAEDNTTSGDDNGLSGHISVVGSTSVTPVATELADAFMAANPNVKIDVQGVGSSAGIKAGHEKAANIGMSSRNLKSEEKEWGLTETIIAFDGIAVAVHPSNGVTELTADQITKIYLGEINNWSEVGGKDEEIIVVSREDGSGTRGAYEDIMGIELKDADGNKYSGLREDALIADGNGAVKANVASKENAIGYLSLSYLDDSVQTVVVDGAEPTVESIKAGEYSISRPFIMVSHDESGDLAEAYLDFILSSDGQAIVGEKLITVE